MDWKRGYYAEGGYTFGFYPETLPSRLAWVANLKGIGAATNNFRYLDLGCGQGLSLIIMAALNPDSEFVGIDFMPEHIAHGRELAKKASLSNVKFIEGDFIELSTNPQQLGEFDYIIAHGITTWISTEARDGLFALASSCLKPGGLMYNSYNTFPGWLPTSPFQNLVIELQKQYSGPDSLRIAQEIMTRLKEAGSGTFTLLPSLDAKLENMSKLDSAYLVQEYNNQFWRPVYSRDMINIANSHKLEFVASATLPEVFDGSYSKETLELINNQSDVVTKETIRDLAIGQSFRRDIYAKGRLRRWPLENINTLMNKRFVKVDLIELPKPEKKFEFQFGTIIISGQWDVYTEVLDAFSWPGASIGDILPRFPKYNLSVFAQLVSYLIHGGWLAIKSDNVDFSVAKKLNHLLAESVLIGAPYSYVCCPAISTAVTVQSIDLMLIGLLNQSIEPEELANNAHQKMKMLGKQFVHDNKLLENENEALIKSKELTNTFIEKRLNLFQNYGSL